MHKPSPAGFWGDKKSRPQFDHCCDWASHRCPDHVKRCVRLEVSSSYLPKKYEVPLTKFAFLKDEKSTKATRLFN